MNYEWWTMNDELWMMNYEWWMMNDELLDDRLSIEEDLSQYA